MTVTMPEPTLIIAATPPSTTERDQLLADLETIWTALDGLVARLTATDWRKQHGPDWIVADLPYHLSYFDRELIATGIERGEQVPASERRLFGNLAAFGEWNDAQFDRRPAGQAVEVSLAEMRASRDAIRRVVAGLADADLDRPVWTPICGWRTARGALRICAYHTMSHATELRLRLGLPAPVLPSSLEHAGLTFYLQILGGTLDRTAAVDTHLTAVFEIAGPEGGAWTFQVADGVCHVSEGRIGRPDLVLTQSTDGFMATMTKVRTPTRAMLTGRLKIRGLRRLPVFSWVFHPPALDQPLAFDRLLLPDEEVRPIPTA